jgi:hypothetical protein
MTHCFAFKYEGDVFLYADAAFTTKQHQELPSTITSFGEANVQKKDEVIFEAITKIFRISDCCAVAFAGCTERARAIIDILRSSNKYNSDLEQNFEVVNNTIDSTGNYVELLIADCSRPTAQIIQWNTSARKLISTQEYASIGSLPNSHDHQIKRFTDRLVNLKELSKDSMLSAMAATFQSYGLRNYLMENNVGGSVLGAKVSTDNVSWLPDTTYLIFDADGKPNNWVSIVYRDGGLVTHSSYSLLTTYFISDCEISNIEEWRRIWNAKVSQQIEQFQSINWVFLNSFNGLIVIVEAKYPISKTTVSEVSVIEDKLKIEINGDLLKILKEEKSDFIMVCNDRLSKDKFNDYRFESWVQKQKQIMMNNSFKDQ